MTDLLWHYTDAAGLLGIVEKSQIWLTHVDFLNDSQEYRIARDLLHEVLAEIGSDTQEQDLVRRFAQVALARLQIHDRQDERFPFGAYVASFSTLDDDLSQWRAYGRSGAKFSIGFSKESLMQWAEQLSYRFGAANYDNELAKQELRRQFLATQETMAKSWIGPASGFNYTDPDAIHIPSFLAEITKLIEPLRPWAKHSAFKSESEYRLVADFRVPPSGSPVAPGVAHVLPTFRQGPGHLIPYICADIPRSLNAIREIRVGPTSDPVKALSSIQFLVDTIERKGHCENMQVASSKIPFRDW